MVSAHASGGIARRRYQKGGWTAIFAVGVARQIACLAGALWLADLLVHDLICRYSGQRWDSAERLCCVSTSALAAEPARQGPP